MIEIEKKFLLADGQEESLVASSEFIAERVFTDMYYDQATFSLTTRDRWLRMRDRKFQLKIPLMTSDNHRAADQYQEIEDEAAIRAELGLPPGNALADDLATAEYFPFCVATTTRRKFQCGDFVIDIDAVEFGEFTYRIGEIELTIADPSQSEGAIARIREFAASRGLTLAPVRGKIIEYLRRVKPDHYQALVAAGVVIPEQDVQD